MALLFCDGMDAYTALADSNSKGWTYTTAANFSSSAGKFGGGSLGLSLNFNNYYFMQAGAFVYAAGYTLCIGFYMKQSGPPSAAQGGTTNAGLLGLDLNTVLTPDANGFLHFYPYGSTTANATIGSHNVCDNQYHWIEMQIVLATGATGSVKVYVDGVLDISLTSLITVSSGTPAGSIKLGAGSNNGSTQVTNQFDDFMVWDTTGSSFNTFPIGPRRIATLIPNAAGASTQFTPSSGANYAAVAQAYSGTAYVQDSSTGNTDLYATAGLGYTPLSVINAAVVNTFALNPAGSGSNALTAKLRSGSTPTVASGTSRTLGSATTNKQDAFYADALGTAWTATTINAAQPGIGD